MTAHMPTTTIVYGSDCAKYGRTWRITNLKSHWKNLRVGRHNILDMLASAVVCAEDCKGAKEYEEHISEKCEPIVPSEVFNQDDTAVYAKSDGESR